MPFESPHSQSEKNTIKQNKTKKRRKSEQEKTIYIFNGLIKNKCQMFSVASIYSEIGISNESRSSNANANALFKFVWMFTLNLNSNSISPIEMVHIRNALKPWKIDINGFSHGCSYFKHLPFSIRNSLAILVNWFISYRLQVSTRRFRCSFHLIFDSMTNKKMFTALKIPAHKINKVYQRNGLWSGFLRFDLERFHQVVYKLKQK